MLGRLVMQNFPININNNNYKNYTSYNPSFGHGFSKNKESSPYTKGQRALIFCTTALGVAASTAILAKRANYSLKPSKMFKNIKNSYLANVKFTEKEVISIGAGSCLGGLAGGLAVDKNKDNRKAKFREAIMQIGNISIPILSVEGFSRLTKKSSKITKAVAAISGLLLGVYVANILMNFLGNAIFKNTSGRNVKATDFTAHVDDMAVAANYISDAKIVHYIARIIPLALMFAGNEVGNKTADN